MWYKLCRGLCWVFLRLFCGIRYRGRENIEGIKPPYIIICNHFTYRDPLVIHYLQKQQVFCMAKQQLFDHKLLGKLLYSFGAFPVDRTTNDITAIKKAIKILRDGKILGIFPEGTRSKSKEMLPFLPGAAMLAIKLKTPVVPVYITGRYKMFSKNCVYIGKPFDAAELAPADMPPAERYEAAAARMREIVLGLKPEGAL